MSGAPLVTLDIGNTRCKACLFPERGGAPRALFDVALAQALQAVAEVLSPASGDVLGRCADPGGGCRGAISSVADADPTRLIGERLERALGSAVAINPDSGLDLDVEHPETIGRDRLFAARGALELVAAPAIVVDAGTALTVDALAVAAHETGRFLGGAIAPGPDLMASSLGRGGARLWNVAVRPRAPALGKHTAAALEAGACVGFEGAALHLVRRVAHEAGFERPRVVLTGGRRDFLEHLPFSGSLTTEPHLVHIGLAAAVGG